MLAASLNAFFCASPIYGSAEDSIYLLDVTVSRDVTPAAKQQIGETRKKRLAKRLAFFRFDLSIGIIKGEQPLIRASRASKVAGTFLVLFWCAKENFAPMQERFNPRHRRAIPHPPYQKEREPMFHMEHWPSPPHLCAAAVGMRTVYSMYPSRSSRCAVAGTPLSVIRRMAWSIVFTKMRTSFTIEMR